MTARYVVTADKMIRNGEVVRGLSIRSSEDLPERPTLREGRLEEMIKLVRKLSEVKLGN